ncbi:MAG: ParA family protein [Chloroflexia bacterium]|nr:ParA family protein [Chloroflexia bacterium]
MAYILTLANQKGGVGKTTTAVNLSAFLADQGYSVLLVDADPQGNATTSLGLVKTALPATLYEAMLGQLPLDHVIVPSGRSGLYLVPSTLQLAGVTVELLQQQERERRLARLLQPHSESYDFICIDSPPSLGLLTVNALVAAAGVLIPLQCEYLAMEGLAQLLGTVERVRQHLNPGLHLIGILMTMFDRRTRLSLEVLQEVQRHLPGKMFNALIPRNVRLGEAPSHGMTIWEYDQQCQGAMAYQLLGREFLGRLGISSAPAQQHKEGAYV